MSKDYVLKTPRIVFDRPDVYVDKMLADMDTYLSTADLSEEHRIDVRECMGRVLPSIMGNISRLTPNTALIADMTAHFAGRYDLIIDDVNCVFSFRALTTESETPAE